MGQDSIFFAAEGDQWFERNRKALSDPERHDIILRMIEKYRLNPVTVLEVGCSNGWRLARIAQIYGAHCTGVEPSEAAIAYGKRNFKSVRFVRGLASDIPLKEQFDLVIVNFVLHWVARESLLRSVSEIDRMVKLGGHLIVGDFFPDLPQMVPYHHLPGQNVFTFKQEYARIFTSSELYHLEANVSFDHADGQLHTNVQSHDRASIALLTKHVSHTAA